MTNKPHSPDFTIDAYLSGKAGTVFSVTGTSSPLLPELVEDTRVFSYARYGEEVHPPVPLPGINTAVLDRSYPRCLDMLVRVPGEETYAIPDEWAGLLPLLTEITATEQEHNPNWRDYHTYLTVDCKQVSLGAQQRHGGLHVDGFQGKRIRRKTKTTRNYVVTTNGGTRFYPQKFAVVDPAELNVFQGFDLQARDFIIAEENVVHFMDAYAVHESGFSPRTGLRTFLRMTYDLKEFDRLGNTHNSMLDYNWEMVERAVHKQVHTPTADDIKNALFPVV